MDYNELSRRIHETFIRHVIPSNVLHVFRKYNLEVLTDYDIDKVKACSYHSGNMEASSLLLERLGIYNDWFSCLLLVLRDKDVKLGHIADKFEQIYQQLKEETGQQMEADVAEQAPIEESKNLQKRSKSTYNSLPLWNPSMEDPVDGPHSADETHNSSLTHAKRLMSRSNEAVGQSELSHHIDSLKLHQTSTSQSSYASLNSPLNRSVATMSSRWSFSIEDDAALPTEGHHSNLPSLQIVLPDNRVERAVTSGLPHRDFGQEEVYNALNTIPGWSLLVSSNEIRRVLKPYLDTPGYYVIWFWEKHARPAISFTLNGEIATLIFHKRQATDGSSKMEYYLTKDSRIFGSLGEIAEYCITKGVLATSDQKTEFRVTFKYPVESR